MDMKEEYKGYTIALEQEMEPMDPREWDNLGEMIAYHRDYSLGDHHQERKNGLVSQRWSIEDAHRLIIERAEESGMKMKLDEYGSYEDEDATLSEAVHFLDDNGVVLPLYLLDHSGIWMRTGHFTEDGAGWDTSTVGYIIATPEKIKKEYGVKSISKKLREKVSKILQDEVETYSKYISGDVVSAYVEKDGEHIWSCGGYYESKDAIQEARDAIEYDIKETLEKHLKHTRSMIKNRVPLDCRIA